MPQPPPTASPPQAAAWLGYGGLVPFIALAAAFLLNLQPDAARYALLAYGAVILSFVGALHWGFAMLLPQLEAREQTYLYVWSTVPALAGWIAMLLAPLGAAPVLIAGFVVHYLHDRRLVKRHVLPGWYLPLRLRLSVVAALSLLPLVTR